MNVKQGVWKIQTLSPEELLNEARSVRSSAYVPYSRFPVGAALVTGNGEIYRGCNVENGSYGLSICAERNAVSQMISSGRTDPAAIAITGIPCVPCLPCGACRQVLAEFNPDIAIVLEAKDGGYSVLSLADIFPLPFLMGEPGK